MTNKSTGFRQLLQKSIEKVRRSYSGQQISADEEWIIRCQLWTATTRFEKIDLLILIYEKQSVAEQGSR